MGDGQAFVHAPERIPEFSPGHLHRTGDGGDVTRRTRVLIEVR